MGSFPKYFANQLANLFCLNLISLFLKAMPAATLHQMRTQICTWESQQDQRAIFLRCYAMMTENMLAALEANRFQHPTWMPRLLRQFADYYFQALYAYEQTPQSSPSVWFLAHHHASFPDALAVRNLILGVNAHINYDLALTLVDLLASEWAQLSPSHRQMFHADYNMVNQIIAETTDAVQDQVVEPQDQWAAWVDTLMGPMDEWLISRFVTLWRDQTWETAVQILEAPPSQREAYRVQLEHEAIQRAFKIAPILKQTIIFI